MYCDLWLQYIKVRKLFKGGNYLPSRNSRYCNGCTLGFYSQIKSYLTINYLPSKRLPPHMFQNRQGYCKSVKLFPGLLCKGKSAFMHWFIVKCVGMITKMHKGVLISECIITVIVCTKIPQKYGTFSWCLEFWSMGHNDESTLFLNASFSVSGPLRCPLGQNSGRSRPWASLQIMFNL